MYRDISVLWDTSAYDFLVFFAVHECDDASDVLSGFGRSCVGLRMFRRCRVVDELGDVRQECRVVGLVCARFSLMVRFVSERNQWMISLYSIFFAFVLAGFCIYYLPVFDFRPYHIGVNLPRAMVVPEGEEEPEYLTTFVLEKDGVKKEFTTEDYPEDTAWHFVESRTVLVKEGYVPPVHDFSIMTWPDGEDITEQVLSDKGYTFLLISPYLEFADDSNIDRINELYCK